MAFTTWVFDVPVAQTVEWFPWAGLVVSRRDVRNPSMD